MTVDTRKGWGGGQKLTVGDSTGRVGFQRNFWQARIDESGEEFQEENALVRTITFQVNGFGFPEARITGSVAANPVNRRISVMHGTSICLPLSTVNVDVYDNAPTDAAFEGEYGVSITCAPGTRGCSMQMPGLILRDANGKIDIDIAGAGGSSILAVPSDAGGVALSFAARATQAGIVPIVPGSVAIQMLSGATVLKEYDPVVFPQWVPLVGAIDGLKITNFNAFHIQCGVVLGVDG